MYNMDQFNLLDLDDYVKKGNHNRMQKYVNNM
jgi:hypothetical protein